MFIKNYMLKVASNKPEFYQMLTFSPTFYSYSFVVDKFLL